MPKLQPTTSLQTTPRIGFHAPIAGGLPRALERSRDLGCDTVQIFSRNPRGWAAKPLTKEESAAFMAAREATKITPVAIHANYLINLAASDETIREKSRASLREEIERGLTLGADYLVVHPGSARGASEAEGVANCAALLKAACDGLNLNGFRVLLENTAGSGACIGHRFEHLRDIIAACPELNLGMCLDTAHSFAAGYDWREEDGCAAAFEVIERCVGLANVRVVHFNDSKVDYLSRVDRHWHIGLGKIGSEGLARVARHAGLRHAAFILETPQDEPGAEERNIGLLRSFISGK